jgi:type II secretory ATPase GspE/PulE/Tfp pilus assembly ATPase PilB-like protein
MVVTTAPSEDRLGQLLLEEGLVTREQLDTALAAQAAARGYVPLGRILVERKAITARQLSLVMERGGGRVRVRLGELLVRDGALTEARLQQALLQQQRLQRPLGEVLVKMGFLTDEAMRQALGLQLNIPYIDLDRIDADPSLARLINSNYARRQMLVPIARVGQMLTVCMDDPTNTVVIDELAASTGQVVNVVTSAQSAIKRAFQRFYGQPMDAAPTPAASQTFDFVQPLDESDSSGVDLGEGSVKSEFVSEYVQGKSAEAAVRQLLAMALDHHSSDIHLETLAAGTHVRFRVDGILQELELGSLQEICNRGGAQIISRIKILAKLDIAERRRPQDGSFRARIERNGKVEHIDFRVSILPGYYGESCVLRVLDKKNTPTSIDQLGFSGVVTAKLQQLLKRPAGIMLVAGPTGSGKSTTLYASLMTTYRPEIRVLTAEDPIEYVYDQFSQSEVNERIGNTFQAYLRAFLRHDPEVIMVGEIRDEETAEMAFRAAQTGHLLLSTLHSNDAISTVSRLLDLKVDPNLIASSLLGVLAQRLIRCVCAECRKPYEPAKELVREFFPVRPDGLVFYQGTGCRVCNFTGYKGRMSIAELWAPDAEDAILISKQASFDELRTSAHRTTISMAQDVMDRLIAGRTTLEELIRVMPYASVYQFRQFVATGLVGVETAAAAAAAAQAEAATSELEAEVRLLDFEPKLERAPDEPLEAGTATATADGEVVLDPALATGGGTETAPNDRLLAAFRDLDRARSLTEVLNVLADHAVAEAGRVAILTVANSRLRGRALRGWEGADAGAIDMPIAPNTIFDIAITRGRPVSTADAPAGGDGNPLPVLPGVAAGGLGLAVPVVVSGGTVAILYASPVGEQTPSLASNWQNRVDVLARHAGWCLEVLTRATSPVKSPRREQ